MSKHTLQRLAEECSVPLWELEIALRLRGPLRIETSLEEAISLYQSESKTNELHYAARQRILFHVGYLITWATTAESIITVLEKMPFVDSEIVDRGYRKILELARDPKWPLFVYKQSEPHSSTQRAALRTLVTLAEQKPSR